MKCGINTEFFRFVKSQITFTKNTAIILNVGSQRFYLFKDHSHALSITQCLFSDSSFKINNLKKLWAGYDRQERNISFRFGGRVFNYNGTKRVITNQYLEKLFGFVPTLAYRCQ